MNKRLLVIITCAAVVIVVAIAQMFAWDLEAVEETGKRYIQHEEDSWLDDLPDDERQAASSLNIDAKTFASHLPVVSIDTNGQEIPGRPIDTPEDDETNEVESHGFILGESKMEDNVSEDVSYTVASDGRETIATSFKLFYADGHANRLSDAPSISTQAEIRYRGHSSRHFEKPCYAVTFTQADRVTANNLDVLGMGTDDDWVLYGPFIDKTLLRNYLVMNLAGQFMPYVPDVRFCELFVNGSYQGVYILMESIKADPNRVDLTESNPNSEETSYLVRLDWEDDREDTIDDLLTEMLKLEQAEFDIIYPNNDRLTDAQKRWITDNLTDIEKAIYSYDYDTFSYGYWNYLDVDSFVNYAVLTQITANIDQGHYSTFFYRDLRGKLCAGPVWDFNGAFNNYIEDDISNVDFIGINAPAFFNMLYRDESFTEACINRYRTLRQGCFSDEYLHGFIDNAVAYLGPAIQRNDLVWGYTYGPDYSGTTLLPESRNPGSYSEALDDLTSYLDKRLSFLDDNIVNLRQYSHESAVKRYNH